MFMIVFFLMVLGLRNSIKVRSSTNSSRFFLDLSVVLTLFSNSGS